MSVEAHEVPNTNGEFVSQFESCFDEREITCITSSLHAVSTSNVQLVRYSSVNCEKCVN